MASRVFARTAISAVRRSVSQQRRRFGGDGHEHVHMTFEPAKWTAPFPAVLIGGLTAFGVYLIKHAVDHQNKKHGFDKNPIGFTA